MSIVSDVAHALKDLHSTDADRPAAHGSVKPTNVVLDSKLNAKLCGSRLKQLLKQSVLGQNPRNDTFNAPEVGNAPLKRHMCDSPAVQDRQLLMHMHQRAYVVCSLTHSDCPQLVSQLYT